LLPARRSSIPRLDPDHPRPPRQSYSPSDSHWSDRPIEAAQAVLIGVPLIAIVIWVFGSIMNAGGH
jgi:hypothetical protein